MVFLQVWGKVYIFLKCSECIFLEGPKALKEIFSQGIEYIFCHKTEERQSIFLKKFTIFAVY